MDKREMLLSFEKPIMETTVKMIHANSVVFQNAGEQTVKIDPFWEIPPGGTFSFGSTENPLIMFSQSFKISFSGQGEKLLQIATIVSKSHHVANYEQSKKEVGR